MEYIMFYNPYTLLNMYYGFRVMYDMYISYTLLVWIARGSCTTMLWILSWFYNPYQTKQLENRLDQPD